MATVALKDISTVSDGLGTGTTTVCFMAASSLMADKFEYGMGMQRGDLIESPTDLSVAEIRDDLKRLYKTRSWALLPDLDVLEKIRTLFSFNYGAKTLPTQRLHFSEVLPVDIEYEYQFLPIILPQPLPLHIGSTTYTAPFADLPRVRSRIHPCFIIIYLFRHMVETWPTGIDTHLPLIYSINHYIISCFPFRSWFGPKQPWSDFGGVRPLIFAVREDPKPVAANDTEELKVVQSAQVSDNRRELKGTGKLPVGSALNSSHARESFGKKKKKVMFSDSTSLNKGRSGTNQKPKAPVWK